VNCKAELLVTCGERCGSKVGPERICALSNFSR